MNAAARIVHDGWIRKTPALSGAEQRELESRASALSALKRELHLSFHAEILAALVRAHEARDVDARRPATAAEIAEARAASEAMRVLLERLTPERPVIAAPVAQPAAVPAPQTTFALAVQAPDRSKRRRAA